MNISLVYMFTDEEVTSSGMEQKGIFNESKGLKRTITVRNRKLK